MTHRRKQLGITALLCLVLFFAAGAFAGVQDVYAMSCYIDAQPEQAEVGQDVVVTIVFSGDNVGRVRATLEYDKSVLSYQGEEGDTGVVSLYMAGSGDGISYSLPFKAVGGGSSDLTMTPLDAYDMDELSISLPESQSMSVTVTEPEAVTPQPADSQKDTPSEISGDPENAEKPDKGKATESKDTKEKPRSHASLFILAGAAVLFSAALIAVLVYKRNRSSVE